MPSHFSSQPNAALVVAHPAHELRLLGWLEIAKPVVFALTDGRGRQNRPRIDRTARIVDDLGARRGSVFGDLTDSAVYESLLLGEHDLLLRAAERLADGFVRNRVEMVVVDAYEDAFLTHDVLNAVVRCAVLAASERVGTPIACYDYPLEQSPLSCPVDRTEGAVWLRLSAGQLQRKLAVARSYSEVQTEVDQAFTTFGEDAFAVECLRPLRDLTTVAAPFGKPIYETHGEQMVRERVYGEVVRYQQHVLPLLKRLAQHAPLLAA